MKIEIKHRWDGSIKFEGEFGSLKIALEAAVSNGADLKGAYLEGADLKGAYLKGAYLKGADLKGADLKGADLKGADMEGAYLKGADLKGADLKGAYLKGADLKGADMEGAYLEGAYLEGALYGGEGLEIPILEKPYTKILEAINRPGCKLDMGAWHTCETTHCLAGWVTTLAGEAGKKLESISGPSGAATLILKESGSRIPNYYANEDEAMKFIEKMVKLEA